VLLTVSGVADACARADAAAGVRPARDYVELADAMGADVLDVEEARRRAGRAGRLLERVGGAPALLAWVCFRQRRRYDAVFTDGEQVGLPLALLCRLTARRPFAHVMIVHILSVPKKAWLYRLFRLGRYVDTMVVYSTRQAHFVHDELRFPSERVVLTPFMVDTRFFDPARVTPAGARPLICTAGLEFRDYPTLIDAVRDLPVRVVIAAASPWSKRDDSTEGADLPPNVEVARFNLFDLRQLYADATFVVMPLHDVDFQAGVTTILEAMAMGKTVICTRTRGQTDVVVDGETGMYVPPGDATALRAAIEALLADPARAERMGIAGRAYAEREADVRVYAARLAAATTQAAARHGHP
jgi:glycosyltransferase involved in cell wall biosynthesis